MLGLAPVATCECQSRCSVAADASVSTPTAMSVATTDTAIFCTHFCVFLTIYRKGNVLKKNANRTSDATTQIEHQLLHNKSVAMPAFR